MITQQQIKYIRALAVQKYRQMYRNFIVEGEKINAELLTQPNVVVSAIFGTKRWAQKNQDILTPFFNKFNEISENELAKISALTTPNEVLSIAEIPHFEPSPDTLHTNLHFYLDGIRDPGNMGTILRIADWFGIPYVYCSPDCTEVYSPKVVQASMGAFLRVKTVETTLDALISGQKEMPPLMGAVLHGTDLFKGNLPSNGILIIGNESKGIRPELMGQLTHRLTIGRHPDGGAESLNAGVATGIITAVLRGRME